MFRRNKKESIVKQQTQPKLHEFDFERISLLLTQIDKAEIHQVISDRTFNDLDGNEVFTFLDRTSSCIGQQYLYYLIRTLPKKDRSDQLESIISQLENDSKLRESIVLNLSKLNQPAAYYLYSLVHEKYIQKSRWHWVIPVLSGAFLATAILSFFYPLFLLLIALLSINFIIHYSNKGNVITYSNAIPQLVTLTRITDKLIDFGVIPDETTRDANKAISKICKSSILLKWESIAGDDFKQLAGYFFELIKAALLLEPITIYNMMEKLDSKREEIKRIFESTARIDAALSILTFRESLPCYCIPDFSTDQQSLVAKDLYHPLIDEPVANSVEVPLDKSVLISGSNMSGKTTFIRTIGINTILSQTINTACASSLHLPAMKVFSAIRVTDDLVNETSYYYQEVKTIKSMIDESRQDHSNLFLLDELFKGTNTIERIASAKAVLSYLNTAYNLVFASTHDLELIEYLKDSFQFYHFEESIQDNMLTFDYKLKSGECTNTNAIKILEINGFPCEVTSEAKELALKIEKQKQLTAESSNL